MKINGKPVGLNGEAVKARLRWLKFTFPLQKEPKDDLERMCNAIHIYVSSALEYIKELEERL